MTQLLDPSFGEPIMSTADAARRIKEQVLEADRQAGLLGGRIDKREAAGIVARFYASEEYLGPISGASVAGWFLRNVKILPKTGGLTEFRVNAIQFALLSEICDDFAAGRPARYVLLKARQFGLSTVVANLVYFLAHRYPSHGAAVVAHKDDATQNMRAMLDRAHDNAPHPLKTAARNSQVMHFAEPSDVRVSFATAEAGEVKRSYTIHWLHCSEIAFWTKADKTDLGLMQAVPDEPMTLVVKESTANGVGNLFWRQYFDAKEGRSSYKARFYPWFIHRDYRKAVSADDVAYIMASLDDEERVLARVFGVTAAQFAWRRACIADKCDGDVRKFHQEYPSTDREAFLVSGRPVFSMELVEKRIEEAKAAPLVFQGSLAYDGDG